MTVLSIDQVSAQLPALISKLGPGEEILLIDGDRPVARVTSLATESIVPVRRRGSARGVLTIVAEDEEHLEDFAEYQ